MQDENQNVDPRLGGLGPSQPTGGPSPAPNQPAQGEGRTVDPIASQPTQGADAAPATTYAGFWIRLVAAFIDGIILGVVNSIINSFLGGLASFSDPASSAGTGFLLGMLGTATFLNIAINVGYYVILTGTYGATLGKMVVGLRVVDANGQKIGFGKAALREIVGKFVSGIVFGLGYLWVAFDEKKQGWHDKIAGTYVVKIR